MVPVVMNSARLGSCGVIAGGTGGMVVGDVADVADVVVEEGLGSIVVYVRL